MSPKGGQKLKDLWHFKRNAEANLVLNKRLEPEIYQNYYTLRVGYAATDVKAGETLLLLPDDALHLYNLLRKEFE